MTVCHRETTDEAVVALIEASLDLWCIPGQVAREASGAIAVETAQHRARITRAEPGIPFRWSITVDGRHRLAGSVPGLLRALRMGLDERFRPSRIRIAPLDIAGS